MWKHDPVAIWGAVLATVLGGIRIAEYFRDRKARVVVTFSPNVIRGGSGDVVHCCVITAVNGGKKPVTISGLALQLSDDNVLHVGRLDHYSSSAMPAKLSESDELSAWLPLEEVPLDHVMYAFAKSTEDVIYKSDPI